MTEWSGRRNPAARSLRICCHLIEMLRRHCLQSPALQQALLAGACSASDCHKIDNASDLRTHSRTCLSGQTDMLQTCGYLMRQHNFASAQRWSLHLIANGLASRIWPAGITAPLCAFTCPNTRSGVASSLQRSAWRYTPRFVGCYAIVSNPIMVSAFKHRTAADDGLSLRVEGRIAT